MNRCEHCKYFCQVTIELAGPDGKPWYLCGRCWKDGLPKPKAEVEAAPKTRKKGTREGMGIQYVPDGETYW